MLQFTHSPHRCAVLMPVQDFDIRKEFDEKTATWQFSIVDTIEQFVHTTDARNYWKVLKNRLKKGDNQLVTQCNQLKMRASDGKWYLTDTADSDTLIEIVRVASPSNVSELRSWLAKNEVKTDSYHKENGVHGSSSFPQKNEGGNEKELEVDVLETPIRFVIIAFVEGIEPEHVIITVSSNEVSIKCNRTTPRNNIETYAQKELSFGLFSRVIPLPAYIDINEVEATVSRGLLKIELSKINLSRTREVKVKNI